MTAVLEETEKRSKPADFRQLILDRLTEIGWSKARLAKHNRVTMHPVSVFRYLRSGRDTDGTNIAELLHILGYDFSVGGWARPAQEPTSLRSIDGADATIIEGRRLNVALENIAERLNTRGIKSSKGGKWTRDMVWTAVKRIKKAGKL